MADPIGLTFYGTSAGFPTERRPHTSAVGLWRGAALYLFDAGDGLAGQLAQMRVAPGALRVIFLTHLHADHASGLPVLIQWLQLRGRTAPLRLWVPEGSLDGLRNLLHFLYLYPIAEFDLDLRPLSAGQVTEDGGVTVSALASHHLEPGEDRRRRRGARAETQALSYRIEAGGARIYLSGDIAAPEEAARGGEGADVAVVEIAHFTPEELGRALGGTGIRRLILNHVLDALEPAEQQLPDRLRAAGFAGEVIVATDGLEVRVRPADAMKAEA